MSKEINQLPTADKIQLPDWMATKRDGSISATKVKVEDLVNLVASYLTQFASNIVIAFRGAVPSTSYNPGTPIVKEFWLAMPGTYTNFKDASNTAITIPAMVGSDYVLFGFLIFDGTAWVASYKAITILIPTPPKASGLEIDKGIEDAKFITPLGLSKSFLMTRTPISGTTGGDVITTVVTEALTIATQVGLTSSSNVWTGNLTAAFQYNNYGISAIKMVGDGNISWKHTGSINFNAIVALRETNVNEKYTSGNYKAATWFSNATTCFKIDGGTTSSIAGVTPVINNYYRINRTGSVLKMQTSTTGIGSWTDVFTFTYSSSGDLYFQIDLDYNSQLNNPIVTYNSFIGTANQAISTRQTLGLNAYFHHKKTRKFYNVLAQIKYTDTSNKDVFTGFTNKGGMNILSYGAAYCFATTGAITIIDKGIVSLPPSLASFVPTAGYYYRIIGILGVYKLQSSPNAGVWTDLYTFSYNNRDEQYVVVNPENGKTVPGILVTDTRTFNSPKLQATTGTRAHFFGDSITAGYAITIAGHRWTTLLSSGMGLTEINYGLNGTTLIETTPTSPFTGGSPSMRLRAQADIPVKSGIDRYLFIAYSTNDIDATYNNYNIANFTIQYHEILDIAASKGWIGSNIVIVGGYYLDATGYANTHQSGSDFFADHNRALAFIDAAKTVAIDRGTQYIDFRDTQIAAGGLSTLDSLGIHPTDGQPLATYAQSILI